MAGLGHVEHGGCRWGWEGQDGARRGWVGQSSWVKESLDLKQASEEQGRVRLRVD